MQKRFIKIDDLIIENLKEDDIDGLVAFFENEDIKKTYMIPDFKDKEETRKLAKKQIEFSNDDKHYIYGVYKENKLIGFFNDCGVDVSTIEMGYFIDPQYQNQGIGTKSFKAVIIDLFDQGFNCIRAGYFEDNLASKKVMEKCMMKQIEDEDDVFYRGENHHCKYMEIKK